MELVRTIATEMESAIDSGRMIVTGVKLANKLGRTIATGVMLAKEMESKFEFRGELGDVR